MLESFTAGALRALGRAEGRARARGAASTEPVDLLIALAEEAESRAAEVLAGFGLTLEALEARLGGAPVATGPLPVATDDAPAQMPHSTALRAVLADAVAVARSVDRGRGVGTEHLLAGLVEGREQASALLARAGLDPEVLAERLDPRGGLETGPIPIDRDTPAPELADPTQAADLHRILDASANRAREGLRVVEDYARFQLDDPGLTRRLKDVRHRLAEALRGLDPDGLLVASRDTVGDVGTHIIAAGELVRDNPRGVLAANFRRVAEALRSLEEYAKLIDVWLAGRFEVLRYDVYTLEKLTLTAASAHRALGDARLMVLVGGLPTLGDLTWVVAEALAGGAQVIQIREKGLDDREWLRRAREVRILTAQAGARLVVNDRADLARLAAADGVHLGQDDLTVRDARRVVGPNALVGVSTHDPAQLERAVLDGAGYLGVGPVFPSGTKTFEGSELAGLAYVEHASSATRLPWFAIGGITPENLDAAVEAGARRVAVSGSVVKAERPRQAAAHLRQRLDALGPLD